MGRVVCPVLSKHVCELCGESGYKAHTRKFCSMNPLTFGRPQEEGFLPGMLPKDIAETALKTLALIESIGNDNS